MPPKPPESELKRLAELLRMSLSELKELMRHGVIVQTDSGSIDTAQSLLSISRHLLATRSTAEAKARAAEADAELKELKLAAERKKTEGKQKQAEPKQGKAKAGRSSTFSEKKAAFICNARAQGQSINSICEEVGISRFTFYKWRSENKIFSDTFARAQECALQGFKSKLEEYVQIDDSFLTDESLEPELRMKAGERAFNKLKYIIEVNTPKQEEEQNEQQAVAVSDEQMKLWAEQIAAARKSIEQQAEGKEL